MAEILFWASFILLLYAYIGYPMILNIISKPIRIQANSNAPKVSIVLAVYNESEVILDKIANFQAIDYPRHKLEMIVVSDASNDGTDDLVKGVEDDRISLIVQLKREGKNLALNSGVSQASGEILVFTDADSMFKPDAVSKLVKHFSDTQIGLVSGRSIYIDSIGNESTNNLYRIYEDRIKEKESGAFSIVGADGAIYALRKELFIFLPSELINDFIHSFQVVISGKKAVSEPEAICIEKAVDSTNDEFSRQTRIMAQSWRVVLTMLHPLITAGQFGYVWQVISHKLLRWLSLPLMLIFFVANCITLGDGWLYIFIFLAQIVLYISAAIGWKISKGYPRKVFLFMLLQVSASTGLLKHIQGDLFVTWEPRAG